MWQPASQVGLVVLQPPPIPNDHEVPLIESKFKDDDVPPVMKANRSQRSTKQGQGDMEKEPQESDTSPDTEEQPEGVFEEGSEADQREWEEEEPKAER